MKTFILALLVCLAAGTTLVLAEPFGTKVDVPEKMLKSTHPNALDAMMVKNSKVPSQEAVNFPSYPDALILQTQQPSPGVVNGEKVIPNHMIVMGTVEPVDQVVSFYQKQLSDWTHKEKWGNHIFHKGDKPFELMSISSMSTAHIQIREALPGENPFMQDMKTLIEIYYRPQL